MAEFTLRVEFTGLCSFVPNDKLEKATKLMVVLPDADFRQIIGTPPPLSLDHEPLRRHKGMIRIPLTNLGLAKGPDDGAAIRFIAPGARIQFKTDPPSVATSGTKIVTGTGPDSFLFVAP